MNGHGVPDLGAPKTAQIGSNHGAIVRRLNAQGTFEAKVIQGMGPNGPVLQAVPERDAYVDAEQLVEMFALRVRAIVREEIKALKESDG